jgi:[acyl-carrier-protein] S-malonyltransferase
MDRGTALLFPGHAARRLDATLRAFAGSKEAAPLLDLAAELVGVPLARLLARPALLDRTEILQPVLTALSLVIAARLAGAGVRPVMVLGHSLGELPAWSAAGAVAAADAVRAAALRGRLLAREAQAHPGGMVALATSEQPVIEAALELGRRRGALHVASESAPDQTVLAGDEAAIQAVIAAWPAIAERVPTNGPWHCPSVAGAVPELREALRALPRSPPAAAIVSNGDGALVADPDGYPDVLAEQVARPIAWTRTTAAVAAAARAVVIIGEGSVMRALWHRNVGRDRGPALLATDNERALDATLAALARGD